MTGFGDAFSRIAAAMSGEDDGRGDWADKSAGLIAEIQAEQERDYARKVAKWERDAPRRAMAERAMRAADERRARELGLDPARVEPMQIAAAACFQPPQPPAHLR